MQAAYEYCKNKAVNKAESSIDGYFYDQINNQVNKQVLGKGCLSKVGNSIVNDSIKNFYYCPDCSTKVWVVSYTPYQGACEKCLSKKNISGKALSAFEGVGNSITPDSIKKSYKCPKCKRSVYVVKGVPYGGECVKCLSDYSTTGKGLKVMEGVGNKIVSEDYRTYYKCPECYSRVYVFNYAPYRGACVDCMSKKNVVSQAFSGVKGFFSAFF